MIRGLSLGFSIAVFLTSLGIIITGFLGAFRENMITGASIGVEGIVSYAIIGFIFSFVALFFLVLIIKTPHAMPKVEM
jgi:hypothetical protein